MVPGGGPALSGDGWITAKHPDPSYAKPYLVNNVQLGRAFRKRFLLGLRSLVRRSQLKLEGDWQRLTRRSELDAWCDDLKQGDWNVFIKGPPHGASRPQHVLQYLTRYLSGGPIHDGRIIKDEDSWIHFYARDKTRGHIRPAKLHAAEFVRRWALHILPKGFTRTRRYGGFHISKRDDYLKRCRQLLPCNDRDVHDEPDSGPTDSEATATEPQCPTCQTTMECISKTRRPSWKHIFEMTVYSDSSIYCPLLHCYSRGPPRPVEPQPCP